MAASGERELAAALMASANLGVYSFGFLSGDDGVMMRGFICLEVESGWVWLLGGTVAEEEFMSASLARLASRAARTSGASRALSFSEIGSELMVMGALIAKTFSCFEFNSVSVAPVGGHVLN